MCTYPPSNNPTGISGLVNTIYDTPALELKDQKKEVMASELFSSLQHIFKSWDYRCLVPYSHKDPEKWRTYDMHGYRAASNQKMLDKVDTFKFEVLFNNWINPKVLAKYAKHPRKAWKRAYGFPYTTPVNWNGTDINTADASPCWWRCAKLVNPVSLIVFCPTFCKRLPSHTVHVQACSRITLLFVRLFVRHHAENGPIHRKMVVHSPLVVTSKVKPFSRPDNKTMKME